MLLFYQISAWVFLIHMFLYAGFYCMLHVNSRETTFQRHQYNASAARFNNIFLKLFDRHATYCYLQVDLKSFVASGAFFLSREATERATISQVLNSRHS